MRAIQAGRFGGPEVLRLREARDPKPGGGQVLIQVEVADTLHLDTVIRRGAFPFPIVTPPYIPGGGVAGTVVDVGPGIDRALLGSRVAARTGAAAARSAVETVGQLAQRDTHSGGYAEQAIVATDLLVAIPPGMDACQGAALINDGMTAMLIAEAAHVQAGEWILVTPAGGGLGSLLVQLMHLVGAHVLGAARGEAKLRRARELGADEVVDYSHPNWAQQACAVTDRADLRVVLDGVGGQIGQASLDLVAPGGRFIAYGAPSGEFTRVESDDAAARDVQIVSLFDLPMAAGDETRLAGRAMAEASAGRITPLIGQTFPLERAAAAHEAIESRGVVGKTLLLV